MAVRIQCLCGELIDARDRMSGREVRCPRCSRLVLVPGPSGQVKPSTVFGLAVAAGILITMGVLLLPDWLSALRVSRPALIQVCAGNLRALGVAIRAYADHNDGWMPSTWDNTFAALAPYLSESDRSGPHPVWRCPLDQYDGGDPANHCSYGVNADETDGGENDANQFHPGEGFRQAGTMSEDRHTITYPGPFAHRVRGGGPAQAQVRLAQLPPRTILLIEHWSPWNTLDLDRPRLPNRVEGAEGARRRSALVLREYRVYNPPRIDGRGFLLDAGTYLFLKPFERREAPLEGLYHGGHIHVLYANGQVELVPIRRLLAAGPDGFAPAEPSRGLGPPWTRYTER